MCSSLLLLPCFGVVPAPCKLLYKLWRAIWPSRKRCNGETACTTGRTCLGLLSMALGHSASDAAASGALAGGGSCGLDDVQGVLTGAWAAAAAAVVMTWGMVQSLASLAVAAGQPATLGLGPSATALETTARRGAATGVAGLRSWPGMAGAGLQ